MTSQRIRPFTNFMTMIPSLTFTELRDVSMEHLQRDVACQQETLVNPSGHLLPSLWDLIMPRVSPTYRVLSWVFDLYIPIVFSRFCFVNNDPLIVCHRAKNHISQHFTIMLFDVLKQILTISLKFPRKTNLNINGVKGRNSFQWKLKKLQEIINKWRNIVTCSLLYTNTSLTLSDPLSVVIVFSIRTFPLASVICMERGLPKLTKLRG